MKLGVTAIFLAVFAASACIGPATPTWRGREFQEVRSLLELPASVRRSLGTEVEGMEGIADAGQPFNRSDAIDNPRWPTRRFAVAGRSGDTYVVAYEHGGFAYGVWVSLFETASSPPEDLPVDHNKLPRSVRELVAMLPK